MEVPVDLVPAVRELLAKRKAGGHADIETWLRPVGLTRSPGTIRRLNGSLVEDACVLSLQLVCGPRLCELNDGHGKCRPATHRACDHGQHLNQPHPRDERQPRQERDGHAADRD
jgi:hypothetical protein